MPELFEKRYLNYGLCSQTYFSLHSVNNVTNSLKSLKYFAGKVWNIVPFEIRNAASLEELSNKIKCWKLEKYPSCRLFSLIPSSALHLIFTEQHEQHDVSLDSEQIHVLNSRRVAKVGFSIHYMLTAKTIELNSSPNLTLI